MAMDPKTDERFAEYLRAAAEEAQRELKYRPSLFLRMLGAEGGYKTAIKLLTPSRGVSDGFQTLWQGGRLDLTVEALVLTPEWAHYFPRELLQEAQKRLKAVGFVREFEIP